MSLDTIRNARTALWHLRRGGMAQMQTWQRRQKMDAMRTSPVGAEGAEGMWLGRGSKRRLSFKETTVREMRVARPDVRAAVILDDFSALAFNFEWQCTAVNPHSWQDDLDPQALDLLFVESAWAGNSGLWRGKIGGANGPQQVLHDLVQWCKDNGIPTVFWNKEDPPHYDDFLEAAKLFDFVYTSDESRIASYQRDLGHERISTLAFAAQHAIHNPIRPARGFHSRDAAFAGMYFAHKYPERREQMDMLLGSAAEVSSKLPIGLEIFSRQLGGDEQYQFPGQLAGHVVGSLNYEQMLTAYKSYKVFLNVNSVVDSPSMCARRIFEISASGTPVLSAHSAAIRNYFSSDEVPVASTTEEAQDWVRALVRSPELNDRIAHRAQRAIWAKHTYSHRAEQVLADIAPHLAKGTGLPRVSVLVSTIRPHQLEHIFATLGAQQGVEFELVLLCHGFEVDASQVSRLKAAYGVQDVKVLTAGEELSLGECLNMCVEASNAPVVTKMDDDDHYGPHYLADQLHAMSYSGADIVGKQAHYVHLQNSAANLVRNGEREHRYTDFVMGPTLMARREVFERVPFRPVSRGEDTAFLKESSEMGFRIYSSDRFNYAQIRRSEGHTWDVTDQQFLATGTVKFYGSVREHADV